MANPVDPRVLLTRLKAADLATSKYHNRRTTSFGITFASKREAEWYQALLIQERAGLIADLELQPRYPLVVNGVKIATYVADFRYWDIAAGATIVADAKGVQTREYRIKAKLMKALYGIEVREV